MQKYRGVFENVTSYTTRFDDGTLTVDVPDFEPTQDPPDTEPEPKPDPKPDLTEDVILRDLVSDKDAMTADVGSWTGAQTKRGGDIKADGKTISFSNLNTAAVRSKAALTLQIPGTTDGTGIGLNKTVVMEARFKLVSVLDPEHGRLMDMEFKDSINWPSQPGMRLTLRSSGGPPLGLKIARDKIKDPAGGPLSDWFVGGLARTPFPYNKWVKLVWLVFAGPTADKGWTRLYQDGFLLMTRNGKVVQTDQGLNNLALGATIWTTPFIIWADDIKISVWDGDIRANPPGGQ